MTDKEWEEIGNMDEDGIGIFWRQTNPSLSEEIFFGVDRSSGTYPWSAANPDTCQHRVLQHFLTKSFAYGTMCVSCDATIDPTFLEEREGRYEYDIDNNVWIYYGPRSKSYMRSTDKVDAVAAIIMAYQAFKEDREIIPPPGESSQQTP